MNRISVFKPSLREVKIWLARLVFRSKNWVSETSLRSLENGFARLVSEEVENGQDLNF